jgi:hypothetical protein
MSVLLVPVATLMHSVDSPRSTRSAFVSKSVLGTSERRQVSAAYRKSPTTADGLGNSMPKRKFQTRTQMILLRGAGRVSVSF